MDTQRTPTRSPDEIKKGLECCTAHGRGRCTDCKSCPFRWKTPGCEFRMHRYALDLINHKEQENAEQAETIERLNNGCHELLVRIQQLEAERDAAVGDIRLACKSYVGRCKTCKHLGHQVDCDEPEACGLCKVDDCPCRSCSKDDRNWEWRGVQKEE